jgi:transcriptional regulator with PAS, ATPase and Fis domain
MLVRFNVLHNKRVAGFEERALQAMLRHHWSGNVRELENLVERGVILAAQSGMISVEHLFPSMPELAQTGIDRHGQLVTLPSELAESLSSQILDSGSSLEEIEALVLDQAVSRARGNLSEAARLLGLTRPQLAYRQKRRNSELAGASAPESDTQPDASS